MEPQAARRRDFSFFFFFLFCSFAAGLRPLIACDGFRARIFQRRTSSDYEVVVLAMFASIFYHCAVVCWSMLVLQFLFYAGARVPLGPARPGTFH